MAGVVARLAAGERGAFEKLERQTGNGDENSEISITRCLLLWPT